MKLSALTRSVVTRTHAIISPDGYIGSSVPGWANCTVNVHINEQMGADFCQTLITAKDGCTLQGTSVTSEIFFFVVDGNLQASVGNQTRNLAKGHFFYVPSNEHYHVTDITAGSRILTFHKVYETVSGFEKPGPIFGDSAKISGAIYLNDNALSIQELLPSGFSFDMAINIFTYQTGGHLPMVETHVMEHGALFLQGQGIYRLDDQWYPVMKDDAIWMAPYCRQWFTAMGKEPSVYIYYKNVNRFPTKN